ncbi:unnamed protein product [Paramecium sonneborni]|uniref:Uncharacterized protein n=1 Tax=Paramecium sonneborni TaxID=65129 RepID=A0A8S1K780_9CILI|nr:unnamed protein product [Paramecium sonneborni]
MLEIQNLTLHFIQLFLAAELLEELKNLQKEKYIHKLEKIVMGGAIELEISRLLRYYARSVTGKAQYIVNSFFASALKHLQHIKEMLIQFY